VELELEKAIQLRKNGNLKKSSEILMNLVEQYPDHATINYHCAWSLDLLGYEEKAVLFYEKAIDLGLSSNELEGAFIGLGSTYRTLGEYEKSKNILRKGMDLFPNNRAIQTFYAMTLYNLGEHRMAIELLLRCLIETTNNEELLKYKKAIIFYSDKLDMIWK
jgi:tetratricopeptide (TPR) repeat protein